MAIRSIQVIPSISYESAGPSYSVPGLCSGLRAAGCDVSLYFAGEDPHRKMDYPYHVRPTSRFPHPRLGRSPELFRILKVACQRADVIHSNSLWMYPNVYPAWAVKGTHCKLVTAPRGTLATWSLNRHKWRKRLFGLYAQYAALRATDMWHATCEKEYEEIRAAGYQQPVAIVPIGMEIPPVAKIERPRAGGKQTVAFFGRIHKVKAVDNLVLAWEKIAALHTDWELVFAGPDDGMLDVLNKIVAERRIERVHFVGEISGVAKYAFLSSLDLYVLPSHTENFGVTVAEALACGTPVIVSKNTPWGGVVANRCGWFVANDVDTLAETLNEAMNVPRETLREMGARGREWIRRDFSWESVGREMLSAYEWLCHGGERPECVRLA